MNVHCYDDELEREKERINISESLILILSITDSQAAYS